MPNTCMNHKSWYTEEDWPCPTFLLFLHAIITSYQTNYFFPRLEVEYRRPTYYSKFKIIKMVIIIRHPKHSYKNKLAAINIHTSLKSVSFETR